MWQLISITREDLEISSAFYKTKKEAHEAMINSILSSTNYDTLDEIIEDANAGLCGFSDDDAWAETHHSGMGQWRIIEVPTKIPDSENLPW